MIRSIVVAVARNGVIGRDNRLPWKLPKDLAYFKRVTMGHPVVMGRRTWESIGKALAGRHNIMVTHNPSLEAPGATVVTSLADAWKAAGDVGEVSIIGGTSIFRETLPIADRIHLTEIEAKVDGDTFFPPFDRGDWVEREVERHPADERHAYPFRIVLLTRRAARR